MALELNKVREAANQLRVSEKTMWAWIARKQIGVYRIGGSVRISQQEIDRLLAEGHEPASGAR
jgi:excisionase family DNA binding protein